jgi:HK97 family phage prohead protease
MRETVAVPFEVKFVGDAKTGELAGHGAVYANVDDGGDMFAPGAFALSLKKLQTAGRVPSMYMQHGAILGADPRPVGKWLSITEDDKGLAVKGQLVGLDTETGKYNHALVKEGAMTGLSVGFRPIKVDYPKGATGPRRLIKEADLFEISIVDQPMNALARIGQVKAEEMTEREMERWLTQDAGFSRSEARVVINQGFKTLMAMRDAGGSELAQVAEALKRNIAQSRAAIPTNS